MDLQPSGADTESFWTGSSSVMASMGKDGFLGATVGLGGGVGAACFRKDAFPLASAWESKMASVSSSSCITVLPLVKKSLGSGAFVNAGTSFELVSIAGSESFMPLTILLFSSLFAALVSVGCACFVAVVFSLGLFGGSFSMLLGASLPKGTVVICLKGGAVD